MKITIFGMAGTGTSSTGKMLAEKLNYPFISGGDIARMTAEELGMTLNQIDMLSKTEKKYDLMRDERLREFGNTNPNFVMDARLGWYNVPDSLKIKLFCSNEVRIKRIMIRENKSIEQVTKETIEREGAIRERFKAYYDLDFDYETRDEVFDLVIDTGLHNLEEVIKLSLELVASKS